MKDQQHHNSTVACGWTGFQRLFSFLSYLSSFLSHRSSLICVLLVLSTLSTAHASESSSVYMEELTWQEIRDRIAAGSTIAIIPTGATEQNGPQMVTGKHNSIVRYTAGEVAKKLGNALVAPVVPYAPSGRIEPPEGHMSFPGTMSLNHDTFARVLTDVASSLKQHGFRTIVFMGDSGGNQEPQRQVAEKLSNEWNSLGIRVIQLSNYYFDNGQENWVSRVGIKVQNPTAHAGFLDTSELMAADARGVRHKYLGARGVDDYYNTGAMGDSSEASAAHGRKLLSLKIQAAYEQIRFSASHPGE